MAMQVAECTIGVDVSKRWLDICTDATGAVQRIDNTATAINRWLEQLPRPARLAVEPTGGYHEVLANRADAAGCQVYLVDPLRVSRYREAIGQRAKTDAHDARVLRRYLLQEGGQLRPWRPGAAGAQRIWCLLKRRAAVRRAEVQVRQSLATLEAVPASAATLQREFHALLASLEQQLRAQARALGWEAQVQRLRQIPGIGPLTAIALVAAWHRGEFSCADRFVAFLGLDVRVRDSGLFRGRRKLSKKGDTELRRLLYTAAMSGSRTACWRPYYAGLRARGLASIAALVALSRKIARLAFALLRDQADFDPQRRPACARP